ncbi:MAG: hypothetical protein ABMA25_04700 [Ilumatobacteraceae bacterium]
MTEQEVLLPAEAARRLGVATRVVVQAMYERRLPRVRLEDGTLGIPADSLESWEARSA